MKKPMKKVAVVGFDKKIVEKELKAQGFVLDRIQPDFVVSFGGDGSALVAEQLYPGVPRLTIKHSKICKKCVVGQEHNLSGIFRNLKEKKYKIVEEMKLEGVVNGDRRKALVGLNEINISHGLPTKSVRFDVLMDNKRVATNFIGDGVVIATPYGSTAYYRSITGRSFSKGIGIAFNNTRPMGSKKIPKYKHANSKAEIKVVINRGPAVMCADNNTTMIQLKDGDTVSVRKAKRKTRLIILTGKEKKINF